MKRENLFMLTLLLSAAAFIRVPAEAQSGATFSGEEIRLSTNSLGSGDISLDDGVIWPSEHRDTTTLRKRHTEPHLPHCTYSDFLTLAAIYIAKNSYLIPIRRRREDE